MPRQRRRGRGEAALFDGKDRNRRIGRVTANGSRHTVSARTKTEARWHRSARLGMAPHHAHRPCDMRRLRHGARHEAVPVCNIVAPRAPNA
jgi:hypothetical protein